MDETLIHAEIVSKSGKAITDADFTIELKNLNE